MNAEVREEFSLFGFGSGSACVFLSPFQKRRESSTYRTFPGYNRFGTSALLNNFHFLLKKNHSI